MIEPLTKLVRINNTHLEEIHSDFYTSLVVELKAGGYVLTEKSKDKVIETWEHAGVEDNGDSTWVTIDGHGGVHEIKNTSSILPDELIV